MGTQIWVLGGYKSEFARNLTREDLDVADVTREVVDGTLGAMPATVREDLWDVPAPRHEAACASGSIAILAAMAGLRVGS